MTIFYRQLAKIDVEPLTDVSKMTLLEPLMDAYYVPEQLTNDITTRIGNWMCSYPWRPSR